MSAESRNVADLPPDKNIPEGKPSTQNNIKWAWLGCVIRASIVFRGPSSGQWPCNRCVFLTLYVGSANPCYEHRKTGTIMRAEAEQSSYIFQLILKS